MPLVFILLLAFETLYGSDKAVKSSCTVEPPLLSAEKKKLRLGLGAWEDGVLFTVPAYIEDHDQMNIEAAAALNRTTKYS